jgi:hypothetical protein
VRAELAATKDAEVAAVRAELAATKDAEVAAAVRAQVAATKDAVARAELARDLRDAEWERNRERRQQTADATKKRKPDQTMDNRSPPRRSMQ